GQEAQRILEKSFEVVALNKINQLTYSFQLKSKDPFFLYLSCPKLSMQVQGFKM
ncbi:hypothetical protein HKBW3S03_01432, partial [Candidatus Hakubella thermalkaliphila]